MEPLAIVAVAAAVAALALMGVRLQRARRRFRSETDAWQQRFEDELRQLRRQRDRLLDALGDAFLIVDQDRRIRFANTAARDLFRGRELVGRTVMEAFLDQRLAVALLRCLETGEPVCQQVVLPQQASPRGAGETRGENAWIIDAAPLDDTADEGRRTRVVIRDVTAEHQTEQVRKDFVANASHELRTPLAIINGYLENLIEDGVIDNRQLSMRFLKVMRKHSARISRIIEDMLVISRLESGVAAALRIKPFPFQGCIHDVLERLESIIREQQVEVSVNMPDPELRIRGDRFYWTQVLFNLVENSLKQNPRPGLKIEIGCKRRKDGIRIWVSDDGVGIPGSDLPFIFRRFYRVEKHHSQDEIPGTGLGLSIVKRAVEAHRGTISVTSAPGRETRFKIDLPAGADPRPEESGVADDREPERPESLSAGQPEPAGAAETGG